MIMNFIKTPLKGVAVHNAKDVGTRTVNLLMGEHVGDYIRGDIMDANAVIQAFDELKGNVDTNHDTLEELVSEIHTNTASIKRVESESKERDEAESTSRKSADNTITNSLNAEISRAKSAEGANATSISNEVTRATAKEGELSESIASEVTRATAKEAELLNAINELKSLIENYHLATTA